MKSTFAFVTLFCALASLCSHVDASEHGKRGIATRMQFEPADETLEKRGGRGTWYNGHDLKDAACYDRLGLDPFSASVNDMIGAMAMDDFEQCYRCMKITNNKNHLSVVVKIVDKCAGCKVNKAIDLTPKAFSLLASKSHDKGSLDVGVLDISWKQVRCPTKIHLPGTPKGLKLF